MVEQPSPEAVVDYPTPEGAPGRLQGGESMPEETVLRLAENIVRRLDPRDEDDVSRIIHQRAVLAGGLMMGMLLFWWLAVMRATDGSERPFLMDSTFALVAWWVGGLALLGTAFNVHSRLRGRPATGLAAGALFLLAAYFPLELSWYALVGDAGGAALWMAVRLVIIAAGLHLAASLGTDAFLLRWVQRVMESHRVELAPATDADGHVLTPLPAVSLGVPEPVTAVEA